MSVQAGQSKSQEQTSSPYAAQLAKFGVQELKGAEPVTQQLLSQESEALRTGGITNQIPLENRRIDAARQAGSQTAQSTRDLLSKYGLANSAFGARILSEETGRINQDVANVPADTVSEILGQAPGVSANATAAGAGLLGQAGNLTRNFSGSTQTMGEEASLKDLMNLLGAGGTSGDSAASGGGSGEGSQGYNLSPEEYAQMFQ